MVYGCIAEEPKGAFLFHLFIVTFGIAPKVTKRSSVIQWLRLNCPGQRTGGHSLNVVAFFSSSVFLADAFFTIICLFFFVAGLFIEEGLQALYSAFLFLLLPVLS